MFVDPNPLGRLQPGVPTKAVLVPKQTSDEADVAVMTSLGTEISEVLDDGKKRLRENQERACFDAAREEILGELLQKEEVTDIWQPPSGASCSEARMEGSTPLGKEGEEKESGASDEDGDSDSNVEVEQDDLTSSLLGGLLGTCASSPKKQKPGNKQKPTPKKAFVADSPARKLVFAWVGHELLKLRFWGMWFCG